MKLTEADIEKSYKIIELQLNERANSILYSLGFIKGEPIEIKRKGFFKGPLVVRIKCSNIMIRYNEAEKILVEYMGS